MEFKWYNFVYEGGSFPVSFRPFGVFYSPQFPASSSYAVSQNANGGLDLLIDFGKFGKYTLASSDNSLQQFEGCLQNTPDKWRKMQFLREFTDFERILYSGGTVWSFEWAKGAFEVELRADSFNHFICPTFPAHSHWSLDGNKVFINWDQYGEYELTLADFDLSNNLVTLTGHKKGQPDNWRRAKLLRTLGADGVSTIPAHDHSHSH